MRDCKYCGGEFDPPTVHYADGREYPSRRTTCSAACERDLREERRMETRRRRKVVRR